MGHRGQHRPLTDRGRPAPARELAGRAADGARDVLHPLITIGRGLRSLAAAGRRGWQRTPRDQRGSALLLAASCLLIVALVPYGPAIAAAALLAAGAWRGRDRTPPPGEQDENDRRLQALYDALVPYFSSPLDPAPLYAHGGDWRTVFEDPLFGEGGRLAALRLRYPPYFTDGEPEARASIERLLQAKTGRGREYRFDWDQQAGRLSLYVLPPLPTDIWAQRFVTAPGETVLGFTDPGEVQRTLPVSDGEYTLDVPPVIWRTGQRSTEPHLLALGRPASGVTGLLRSVVLQALPHGDVVVVDGSGTGQYACLAGRKGVLAVEATLDGALSTLEWAGHETRRRLMAANDARRQGRALPEDVRRPLWIVVDRPAALSELAVGEGRPDPQELLQVPLRHGRAANVTVALGEEADAERLLTETVRGHTTARVVLGVLSRARTVELLGAAPPTSPVDQVPPGRGYARLGTGPVLRVQVPATPDPYEEGIGETLRQAVLALLPPWPDQPRPGQDASGDVGLGALDGDRGTGGDQPGGLGEPDGGLVGDRPAHGERQPDVAFEGAVHAEPGTGRHAYPQPLADLGDPGAGEPSGAHPEGEPAPGHGELPVGEVPLEGGDHGIPALPGLGTPYLQGGVPAFGAQQPGDGELFEDRGAEVGVGTGGHQAANHLGSGAYPAQAQPGPEGLAGRADGDHGAAGGVEGADRTGQFDIWFEEQLGHGLVGDQHGAGGPGGLDQGAALLLGGEGAGGVVEVGDDVGEPGSGVPEDLAPGGQVPAGEPVGHGDRHQSRPGFAHELKDIGVRG